MLNILAHKILDRMSKHHDYDVSYLHYLLSKSPRAFWKFLRACGISRHRDSAPMEAVLTVQLLATMSEDCGPCTQLIVGFASKANMPASQIEAVLTSDTAAMTPAVAIAYRYADAILQRRADADAARACVLESWGDRGLIDLAMAMQGSRLYPLMKNALGYALECRRVHIEGRWVNVTRRAV